MCVRMVQGVGVVASGNEYHEISYHMLSNYKLAWIGLTVRHCVRSFTCDGVKRTENAGHNADMILNPAQIRHRKPKLIWPSDGNHLWQKRARWYALCTDISDCANWDNIKMMISRRKLT